jgi:ferrous iron transport protein A
MNAGDLKIGQSAKIVKLNIENKAFRRRLIDMGLTVNTIITVKKISPVGNPIDILVRGYELILRKEDLQNLEIELM